ncbi:hypothetical protein M0R04_11510 [Candidatus Dojkabacteria bacterium]|jgi:hypothetical protein|nr:hypothetical protein [Candidatus Dojkabacteria bacterium]
MSNGASAIRFQPKNFETAATAATKDSSAFGLPPNADEVGLLFNIVSGSAAAITIKLQHSGDDGTTWVDLAGASITSLISAGTAMAFASTPNTGLVRISMSTLTTPSSLVCNASVIYGRRY